MILEDNGVNKKNFKLNLEFFLLTTFFDLATFLLMKISNEFDHFLTTHLHIINKHAGQNSYYVHNFLSDRTKYFIDLIDTALD